MLLIIFGKCFFRLHRPLQNKGNPPPEPIKTWTRRITRLITITRRITRRKRNNNCTKVWSVGRTGGGVKVYWLPPKSYDKDFRPQTFPFPFTLYPFPFTLPFPLSSSPSLSPSNTYPSPSTLLSFFGLSVSTLQDIMSTTTTTVFLFYYYLFSIYKYIYIYNTKRRGGGGGGGSWFLVW